MAFKKPHHLLLGLNKAPNKLMIRFKLDLKIENWVPFCKCHINQWLG